MNYCGAKFKMGLAFDVAIRSFADHYAKKRTLELKQQLLLDFAATKQLRPFIPDTVHQKRGGMNQQEVLPDGFSRRLSEDGFFALELIQSSASRSDKITGIRSWIVASVEFAAQVRIVNAD